MWIHIFLGFLFARTWYQAFCTWSVYLDIEILKQFCLFILDCYSCSLLVQLVGSQIFELFCQTPMHCSCHSILPFVVLYSQHTFYPLFRDFLVISHQLLSLPLSQPFWKASNSQPCLSTSSTHIFPLLFWYWLSQQLLKLQALQSFSHSC